jgi:hypothetical protein
MVLVHVDGFDPIAAPDPTAVPWSARPGVDRRERYRIPAPFFTSTEVTRMRRHLVVSTGTLIAVMVLLSACGSSSKSPASSGSSTSAPALTNALTCTTFSGNLTLSPPVSPTVSEAHTVNVTGTLLGCTGAAGITSGDFTLEANVTDKLNCAELIAYTKANTASVSVKWNDGTTSTGAEFVVSFERAAKTVISGKVTGGDAFVGKTATAATVNTPGGGGCITPGASLSAATVALVPGTDVAIG